MRDSRQGSKYLTVPPGTDYRTEQDARRAWEKGEDFNPDTPFRNSGHGKDGLPWGTRVAKASKTPPKTQAEKRKEQERVKGEAPKPRNAPAQGLAERGGAGSGKHKNKGDYARGQARKPKHRKDMYKEAEGAFWKPISGGWKHVDEDILAFLVWEDTFVTIQDRKIPELEDLADPELLADGIPELERSYVEMVREHAKWVRQGWWPKPVRVRNGGLHLTILNRQRKQGFEARFSKKELRTALGKGETAAEIIRGGKYPRWMLKQGAYSGNPNGKPIYPVRVDHGENQPLTGGHDIMKRLQDRLRVEQGGSPREPNPRLASVDPKLTQQARKLFRTAWEMEPNDPAARSTMVASTLALWAARAGYSLNDLLKWLQVGYGSVFVRENMLNPGLDLKGIVRIMTRRYEQVRLATSKQRLAHRYASYLKES